MADTSVVDSDQQQSLRVAQTPSFCRLCNVELQGLDTWETHVKSDGHIQKLQEKVHGMTVSSTPNLSSKLSSSSRQTTDEFEDDVLESDSDAEEDDLEEDQELVATEFVPGHCLFCTKDSSTLDESMKHMLTAHGFNIPFQEFLTIDLETLVSYLHFVINTYRECICCGTRRSTVEGIQHHMLAKGHFRFDISPETEEFFEIPQYEDALGGRKQDTSDPVRLPSGRIISYRKHEEPRVARREAADQKRLDPSAPMEPGMEVRIGERSMEVEKLCKLMKLFSLRSSRSSRSPVTEQHKGRRSDGEDDLSELIISLR